MISRKLQLTILFCASAVTSAHAADSAGPLNVSTTVPASCTAPDPSGNLVLPFDSDAAFDGQAFSSEMHLTVECTGGASVTDFAIGWGQRYDSNSNTVYRLLNNRGTLGAGANLTDDACLDYELWYKDEPGDDGTRNSYNDETTDYFAITNNDIYIYGRVSGGLTGGGSPCSTVETDPAQMPAGSYNDIVTLTVKF